VAVWTAVLLLCTIIPAAAQCTGPGAPATTQTKCLTAIAIPGNPIRSFDISWVNPDRAEYYLADRSNKGIDIIDTRRNTFKKTIGGFVGIKLNAAGTAVDNNHSGPDGVTSHGRWLYAGDGDSTLKVIDLETGTIVAILSTGGTTRLDEMALTTDGKTLLAVNNAEDPPFATLFTANGDDHDNSVTEVTKITVDPTVIPSGFGLSIEQPAWDESIQRYIVSVPIIRDNPTGCNYGQNPPPITCSGAILVIDPTNLVTPIEKVVPLIDCGPNGATIGPHGNDMEGCTPNNQPGDLETTIINTESFKYVDVGNLTGSDEVWYDSGSDRYYTGSSAMPSGAVLGVVDGETNFLLETIPQSIASHSVAADRRHQKVFVPQVAPKSVVGAGGDVTTVGQQICGTTNGCIAVYAVPRSKNHDEDGNGADVGE
jgi:3D (Asp-Asp-Asp) domain-containing protein